MRAAPRWLRLAMLLPDYAHTAGLALWGRRGGRREVVQAAVLDAGRVLLCLRRELQGWELPGGHPDPGEGPAEALAREVEEETGLRIAVGPLLGEYVRSGFLPHRARVYRCRVVGGALRPSYETPRVAWYPVGALPEGLFPWARVPLADALAAAGDATPEPVVRHERQGLAAILAGLRIDLRRRWQGDPPAGDAGRDASRGAA